MDASLILTYRCNSKCTMCHTWQHQTLRDEETRPEVYEKLPRLDFINITGGEAFLREDIEEIFSIVRKKTKRVVISSNGLATDRIVRVMEKFPDFGIRISMDGLPSTSDRVRGVPGGGDRALRTLMTLKEMGIKDLGIGTTVTGENGKDLLHMFTLAESMGLEFATSVMHSSFYFHKEDNEFLDREFVADSFRSLMNAYLNSPRPKNWFRAYYVMGIINRVYGQKRPLQCKMGTIGFFVTPASEVIPCNMLNMSMGNLATHSFEDVWNGQKAREVREFIRSCPEQCWMTGSASCVMREKAWVPGLWVLKSKLGMLLGRDWTRTACPVPTTSS